MQFRLPPHPSVSVKSSNLKPQKTESGFCYYINITGPGISQTPYSCAPTEGINLGFLEPLKEIQIDVPYGNDRAIELYGYLARENEVCSELSSSLISVPINRLFRMAQKKQLEIATKQTEIVLEISFPGIFRNIGVDTGMNSDCFKNLEPILESSNSNSPIQAGKHFQIRSIAPLGSQIAQIASGSRHKIVGGLLHAKP